jgi:hypothetical protein
MALSEAARRWLLWAGVVAAILALRVGCVLYDRSRPSPRRQLLSGPSTAIVSWLFPSFTWRTSLRRGNLLEKPFG